MPRKVRIYPWKVKHPTYHCPVRSRVQHVQEENSEIPLPSGILELVLKNPEAFPDQKRNGI